MVRLGISAALAAALFATAPAAQADDTLNKVIGAIAQGLTAQQAAEQEAALWTAVRKRNTVAAYQAYLDDYPRGRYAAEARRIIEGATGKPAGGTTQTDSTAARAEAALNLSRSERSAIQRDLVALAYDPRGTSGNFGPATRKSIRNWQAANGLAATGFLNRNQIDLLRKQGRGDAQPSGSESTARGELALNLSRSQRMTVQTQLNALGFNTGTPDGLFGRGTRAAIANWQRSARVPVSGYLNASQLQLLNKQAAGKVAKPADPAPTSGARDQVEEQLLSLSLSERYEVQRRLNALGYGTGGVDGSFGSGTRRAIARWQGDNGMRSTGYLRADQLKILRGQVSAEDAEATKRDEANARAEAQLLPDTASRLLVEQQLSKLGFGGGTIDGVFTERTRAAIRAYQKTNGQPQSGYVTQQTLVTMMVK